MTNPTDTQPPDCTQLRNFALSISMAFIVVFGVVLPWMFDKPWPLWPWILAAFLCLWGILHPSSLDIIYKGWMKLGLLLHTIISPIVLGAMFYLVFTPTSLLVRLFGKKLIDTEFDHSLQSYRHTTTNTTQENYERPF